MLQPLFAQQLLPGWIHRHRHPLQPRPRQDHRRPKSPAVRRPLHPVCRRAVHGRLQGLHDRDVFRDGVLPVIRQQRQDRDMRSLGRPLAQGRLFRRARRGSPADRPDEHRRQLLHQDLVRGGAHGPRWASVLTGFPLFTRRNLLARTARARSTPAQ